MLKKYHAQLRSIDKEIAFALPEDIPQLFKGIPLKVFAQLTLQEQDLYDNIKTFLPDMADIQTQISWTGNHGMALLNQSIAFIETMMNHIKANYTNEIAEFEVLDYGCGWGRLIRLLYKFFPYTNLYGVDAWEESLKLCYDLKVKANFGRIDELCNEIPFSTTFNIIYAFSVFTHLSKRAAIQALNSIRKSITEDGILILTIRPREYWLYSQSNANDDYIRLANRMIHIHDAEGFAFTPHNRLPVDGDITYGDVSIDLDYIKKHWSAWKLIDSKVNEIDPYQVIVYLVPC